MVALLTEASPACRTGFKRNFPLAPALTIEAQALKSMSKLADCPAAMVNFPPAIWPEGIVRPVCASLGSVSSCGLVALSTTQFQPLPVPQLVVDGPREEALASR